MSCHVDNTIVCTPIEHMLSTTYLYEIHLCILILKLLHLHSCTMEDNPLLVDMCLVVSYLFAWLLDILIAFIYKELLWLIHLVLWLIHSHLIISCLSCSISWASRSWHSILTLGKLLHGMKSWGIFLHGIRAIPIFYMLSKPKENSLHSHWRDYFFQVKIEACLCKSDVGITFRRSRNP